MLAAPLDALLPAIQKRGEHVFDPLGVEQPVLDMADHDAVELVHGDRAAFAACVALPRPDRAGIVAITAVLAGAQRHRASAIAAMANAGQQVRAANDARRRDPRIVDLQAMLHGLEYLKVDQRRHRDGDDFILGLHYALVGATIEAMLADIGAPGQDTVKLANAPTPAVAGEHAVPVQVVDDVLDAHGAGRAVALGREAEDQPHGVCMERVDLQLLLHLRAALLGIHNTVADGRQRAVPEALPGVLLQSPHDVLAVLLGLIFVEQRHDLPHHDVHRIVAHLLRDREQLDAVLGEFPDVELQLEVIAEEAAERMDYHHVERRGLGRAGFDHALKLGAAVVGGRGPGLHEGFDKLIAARRAIGFALLALVGDRHVMLGLPRRGNAQVERGPQGDMGTLHIHSAPPFAARRSISGSSSATRSCSTLGTTFWPSPGSMRTRP
ncbi:hypothetical protein LA66_08370 [Aureimonas altamirensis]|uniref:Uncharacterized protein n=1 Tax=Aureimonas altamirensis TaxID=370622 RepID=A0A0B1Q6R9_9HYPH|nr:hypothetical protein LA66_08370 [Aureimonas altamirensis]